MEVDYRAVARQVTFSATDANNQLFGVSDNRCASGQPAIPPQCISDAGRFFGDGFGLGGWGDRRASDIRRCRRG